MTSLVEQYVTPKVIKDAKFGAVSFIAMVLVIFHYAWIMRQMLLYQPDGVTLAWYFALFGADCLALGWVVLSKVYPIVYAEEIQQDKEEAEAEKNRKTQ